ncbi:hypothetical protein [Metallosphaera sedula]|uniref:hypothetical protein n=1 Tax=Metallosphaera sedula TaxID=43687 RepID=UPI0020C08321|nr:hypothetical protein [Metallosphaera sedula]BBL48346.1 hypothetical protein MJ1HA_2468 [Metallosphaera sedula]
MVSILGIESVAIGIITTVALVASNLELFRDFCRSILKRSFKKAIIALPEAHQGNLPRAQRRVVQECNQEDEV